MLPIFVSQEGKSFLPTARHIWEQLLTQDPEIINHLTTQQAKSCFEESWQVAQDQGYRIYEELLRSHHAQLEQERLKGEYALAYRRNVIDRVCLSQVRDYRLSQLAQEEADWSAQLERAVEVQPELSPILILKIAQEADV